MKPWPISARQVAELTALSAAGTIRADGRRASQRIRSPMTTCPTCRAKAAWHGNPHRPFCSLTCRLIDLGRWLDERYRVRVRRGRGRRGRRCFVRRPGAILCPSCGRLTNADAPACLVCGRRNPGMWGFAGPLRALFRRRSFIDVVTVACIVLYVASLVFDPAGGAAAARHLRRVLAEHRGARSRSAPTGAVPWQLGRWWTLLTAIYLHGGLLHILFNVLWIRQLGPAVEELYGPARLVVIFTVAGRRRLRRLQPARPSRSPIGASGSIFGLLGAMVAFGQKRGGTFGAMVLRQYGQWALLLFVLGLPDAGREQRRARRAASSEASRRAWCCRSPSAAPRPRSTSVLAAGLHRPHACSASRWRSGAAFATDAARSGPARATSR